MSDVVRQTFPLGAQWPTVDPFLFVAHHNDAYPAGDDRLAPAAPLDGRALGQDFSGLDGWSMYHGTVVPGFPSHPHRGFETVTYVRRGFIDHSDSLGATARFGEGDTQWLTAGAGIQHSEMFPLIDAEGPNPLELFQIWLNLPAADKLVPPYFTMLWRDDTPVHVAADADGRTTRVTVVAGALGHAVPLDPPPDSWASRAEADVAIWHGTMEGDASWTMPAAGGPDTIRTLYVFTGSSVTVAGRETVAAGTGAVLRADVDAELRAGPQDVEWLLLQGRPLGEPVAQYGPFVMNTEDEIRQAILDYQETEFGGWPWATPAPDHGRDEGRFAIHADGRRVDADPSRQR